VSWSEQVTNEIFLIDNDSTYPPLLEYYKQTSHTVIYLGKNIGHTSLWAAGVVDQHCPDGYYVYTDPDVIPVPGCPLDVLEKFAGILDENGWCNKVGFGLKTDDIPDHYKFKDNVLRWEQQFWKYEIEPGLFSAPVDTTFALYRQRSYSIYNSLRTGPPYVARHTDWYIDSQNLTEEEQYYRAHARKDLIHWNADSLEGFLK
jgi:hypothetical protein